MSLDRLQRLLPAFGLCALVWARPSSAMPTDMPRSASATDRAALVLVYNRQNPRWEAQGRGPHRPVTKPYKPLRQPPENMQPRQHKARHGSQVLNRFVVLALVAVVIAALAAEWLSTSVHLSSAWIALLFGLVLGPVTDLIDPDVLLGNLLLPVISLFFVVVLFDDLLRARVADFGNLGPTVVRLASVETGVICLGSAVIAAIIGLDPVPAALLAAILVSAQRSVGVEPNGAAGTLLKHEGTVFEVVGIVVALVACEVSLAGHLYRTNVPAALSVAKTVIGGSFAGLAVGSVLAQILPLRWIPDGARRPLLLVVAPATFALSNLLSDGCGFFAVLILGLYLANQKKQMNIVRSGTTIVPSVLVSGLLVVLAARVSLGEMTANSVGGLTSLGLALLVGLLLVARLAAWQTRLPWRAQMALRADSSTTLIVVAAATICGLRLGEFGEPQAERIVALSLLVVFVRLAVSSVAGVFGTRRAPSGATRPKAPEEVTPAAV